VLAAHPDQMDCIPQRFGVGIRQSVSIAINISTGYALSIEGMHQTCNGTQSKVVSTSVLERMLLESGLKASDGVEPSDAFVHLYR